MDSLDLRCARWSSDSDYADRMVAPEGTHSHTPSPLSTASGSNLEDHHRYRCDADLAARIEKRQASSRSKRTARLDRDTRFRNHSAGDRGIPAAVEARRPDRRPQAAIQRNVDV